MNFISNRMKRILILAIVCMAMMAQNSYAQSWKDLLNKDNIEKVVNAVTGKSTTVDITGNLLL